VRRLAPYAALAGDVVRRTARSRVLWALLLVSTALVLVTTFGVEFVVRRTRVVVAPPSAGASLALGAWAPVEPGSVRIEAEGGALVDDGAGRLVDAEGAPAGRVDYAAGAVVLDAPSAGALELAHDERLRGPFDPDEPLEAPHPLRYRFELFGAAMWTTGPVTYPPAHGAPALLSAFAYLVLVSVVASLFGVATGLVLVADAVPSAFAPGAAELLAPRPLPRAGIVLGRFAGGLAFGLVQAGWLVGLTIVAFGLRFGVWLPELGLTLGGLLLKFAVLLALATLAGTWARSALVGVVAAGLIWAGSYGVNTARNAVAHGDAPPAFEEPIAWVQRLFPQVPHCGELAGVPLSTSADPEIPGFSPWVVLAQGVAWTAGPLLLTCAVVDRRDL